MIPGTNDARNDRRPVGAVDPLATAADALATAMAENRRLQQALLKIYGEAMMSTEPPAATWYRIAEIAEVALAREWPTARS